MGSFTTQHLWALLLGIPVELWNLHALETLGNELGRMIHVDELSLEAVDKRVA